jgi:hypothetical protein
MLFFRIEDVSGFDPNYREYDPANFNYIQVDKEDVDSYIATEIRKQINCSNTREVLSYSKSLATCLLKYNNFADNELHIMISYDMNYLWYINSNGEYERKSYRIKKRLNGERLFQDSGKINIANFIIDVSDNRSLEQFLQTYTGVGRKSYASPEKDHEVIVMNPLNDFPICDYMNSIYTVYALNLKYNFLKKPYIVRNIVKELKELEDFRFQIPRERSAIIRLIYYLADHWKHESKISTEILNESNDKTHPSICFDSISQFYSILKDDFRDAFNCCKDTADIITLIFWKYCYIYLYY